MTEFGPTRAGPGSAAGPLDWRSPSVAALVAANLFPMAGVLFFGWSVFSVVFLFWLENVIIGLYAIAKILCARAGPPFDAPEGHPAAMRAFGWGAKAFLAAFFTVHYGMFCFVHGIFVLVLFGSRRPFEMEFGPAREFLSDPSIIWAALGLAASHGVSFVANFIGREEYRKVSAAEQMGRPYGRIVVLHIAIIASGWIVMSMGAPALGLLILIALKIGLDLRAHQREHARIHGGGRIEE